MWVWPQPRTLTLFKLPLKVRPGLEPSLEQAWIDRERFRAAVMSVSAVAEVTPRGETPPLVTVHAGAEAATGVREALADVGDDRDRGSNREVRRPQAAPRRWPVREKRKTLRLAASRRVRRGGGRRMSGWDALWKRRTIPPSQGSMLADLLAADGFDSGFAGLSEASWSAGVRGLAADLGLTPGTSVFEVGCGAGAFLYELERLGCKVGGVDQSPALVAKAAEAIPSGHFAVADAAALQVEPPVDAVISFGVFLYFSSLAYAAQVLDRMVEKAQHVVAVLDAPDLAKREEHLADRYELAGGEAAYAARYAGLDHAYYDRTWLADELRARGLVDIHVEDQTIDGYGNAPFRFNAWGFVAR